MASVNKTRTYVGREGTDINSRRCERGSFCSVLLSCVRKHLAQGVLRLLLVPLVSFACVLVARLASDPEPPRYKTQVVKVAPDFL